MATDKSKVGRKKDEKSCERHNIISFAMCIDVFFACVRVLILKKQQDRVREREREPSVKRYPARQGPPRSFHRATERATRNGSYLFACYPAPCCRFYFPITFPNYISTPALQCRYRAAHISFPNNETQRH